VPIPINKPFEINTDSSDYQLSATILHLQDGRPVAYYSKRLSGPQTRYFTMEKEMLALVVTLQGYCTTFANLNNQCVLHWRCFLETFNPSSITPAVRRGRMICPQLKPIFEELLSELASEDEFPFNHFQVLMSLPTNTVQHPLRYDWLSNRNASQLQLQGVTTAPHSRSNSVSPQAF